MWVKNRCSQSSCGCDTGNNAARHWHRLEETFFLLSCFNYNSGFVHCTKFASPFPTIIPQILWEVLHWSVCFMHADDFYFHFFMGGFSIWNKICSKACTTTKGFSIESKASVLMSGDLQTIETIQDISFIRTNWTAKSNQVQ